MQILNDYAAPTFTVEARSVRLRHQNGDTLTIRETEHGFTVTHHEMEDMWFRPIVGNQVEIRMIDTVDEDVET